MGSITRSDLLHGIYGREWFECGSKVLRNVGSRVIFKLYGHLLIVFEMLAIGLRASNRVANIRFQSCEPKSYGHTADSLKWRKTPESVRREGDSVR